MGDLGGANLIDLETGAFKAKKAKKVKTLEEQSMADLKTLEKKIHILKWGAHYFCLCIPQKVDVFFISRDSLACTDNMEYGFKSDTS